MKCVAPGGERREDKANFQVHPYPPLTEVNRASRAMESIVGSGQEGGVGAGKRHN